MANKWLAVVCVGLLGLGLAEAQPGRPPEEVLRAMEKMKKGQKPTPEEQRAMQEWMASMRGKGGAGVPLGPPGGAGGWGMETDLAGKTLADFGMCPRVKVALPAKAPDRAAYLAAARKAAAAFSDRQRAAEIDARLAGKPEQGSKLGGALLAGGDAAAALYAFAKTAVERPDDALIASNLGVLLTGKRELLDAHAALLWADAKAPDSALVTVNRAWLVYTAGDGEAARGLFERARKLDAELAAPRVGLGLLDGCAGKATQAAENLRAAAARMPSKATTLALALAAPNDPAPDWKGSVPFSLPTPPLSRDVANAAIDEKTAKPILDQVQAELLRLGPRGGVGEEARKAFEVDGNQGMDGERYRSAHKPYQEKVARLAKQHNQDMAAIVERYMKEGPMGKIQGRMQTAAATCGSDDRCRKELEYKWCLEDKATRDRLHPLMYDAIVGGWQEAGPAFEENWEKSTGMIEHMQSKAWSFVHAEALSMEMVAGYMPYIQMTSAWAGLMKVINEMKCVPPPPPREPPGPPPPLPKGKLSDLCDRMDFEVKTAVVSAKIKCSSSTIAWSIPGAKFSFTNDPISNETRIYFGMNAQEGKLSVSEAAYVELSDGVVNRVGGTFEATAGWKDLKVGLAGEGGFATVEGGAPYDMGAFGKVWAVTPQMPGGSR